MSGTDSAYQLRWQRANREKYRAGQQRWRDANRQRVRDLNKAARERAKARDTIRYQYANAANKYDIDVDYLVGLHRKQGGACLICGAKRKLVVDHCHETGVIRGLICQNQNQALGQFKDDPALLRAAAVLETWGEPVRGLLSNIG